MFDDNRPVFRMLRFFSVTSLLCILLAAMLLALFYRDAALDGIADFGESSNLVIARSLLNVLEPELSGYLVNEEMHHTQPLPQTLVITIRNMTKDTSVQAVTVLDDEGKVVFSTRGWVIGKDMSDMKGFNEARKGTVYSKGANYGGMSLFLLGMSRENVIRSYIPIWSYDALDVTGIFAVETDVNTLMMDIELAGMKIFFISIVVMGILYLALLYLVRYAERIIQRQETRLRERSRSLELLSSQLITAQEDEKKRVAYELHEGVAQSLSNIKFMVEHAGLLVKGKNKTGENELKQVVPVVQELIKEVRSLALDVRPPSLDELGVISTLKWYCQELKAVYPFIELDQEFFVKEDEIPAPIKVVLYRAVQQRLQYLVRKSVSVNVYIGLRKANRTICLMIEDSHKLQREELKPAEADQLHLVTLREFLTLSGAEVRVREADPNNGTLIFAEWPT